MRKEHQKPFIILALNAGNTRLEVDILRKNGVRDDQVRYLLGVYTHQDDRQVSEHSYLVVCDGAKQREELIALAEQFKQESVLIVNADRSAELYYIAAGRTEHLNQWSEVSEYTAKQEKSYTFDPVTGKYYVC